MSSNANPDRSLQRQLLLWLLGPLLLLFAVNSILGYRLAISTADAAYNRLLLTSVKAIADRVTFAHGEISVDIPYVALELFESSSKERIFYKVTGPDGTTITGYDDLPPPPEGASRNQPTFFRSQYKGETLYQAALYKPLYAPTLKGMVIVQVGETAESRQALSRRILYDALIPQGLLITFAAVFLVVGIRNALRPLRRLRDGILQRAASDLTPVEDRGVQAEVRPLIQALNQHTERIDRMIMARVNFVGDAAHQIRTRLSILGAQVEYALRVDDHDSRSSALEGANAAVGEATRFFNQLLVLAHAEAKVVPGLDADRVDLAAVAHAVAMDWVEPARAKQIDLAFDGPESGVAVSGNRVLVAELVANLLDNAVRYTQNGGNVTVGVKTEGREILLEVADNGPGIPEAERSRVFQRFYRGASTASEGSGLGLAIAAEICRSHESTIELATAPGGGLIARVRFAAIRAITSAAATPASA